MNDIDKDNSKGIWNKVDKKATEVFIVHFVLAMTGLYVSFAYTYLSFYGLFNPYFEFVSTLIDTVLKKPGFFPKDIHGLQVMWDQPLQDSIMPMQTFIIGGIMLFLGVATLLTCLEISEKAREFLVKQYVKMRFGLRYYAIWMFTQKKRALKCMKKEKNKNEAVLEPLQKAEQECYQQWKKYHKSSLTFTEWKQKVLRFKNKEGG